MCGPVAKLMIYGISDGVLGRASAPSAGRHSRHGGRQLGQRRRLRRALASCAPFQSHAARHDAHELLPVAWRALIGGSCPLVTSCPSSRQRSASLGSRVGKAASKTVRCPAPILLKASRIRDRSQSKLPAPSCAEPDFFSCDTPPLRFVETPPHSLILKATMFQKSLFYLIGPALPYIAGAVAIALTGLLTAYIVRGAKLTEAKADLRSAQQDLDSALRTIAGQKQVLQECSDRTDQLKAEGDKRVAAANEALARAQQEAARYQAAMKRIDALRAAPSPSGASCQQAVQALRRELRK